MTMTKGGVFERAILLTGREAAEWLGISYNAWKCAPRTRAGRPPPDDVKTYGGRVVKLWRASTLREYRATRRPTHAQILADPRRVSVQTVRRHLRRHRDRLCSCYITPTKGQRI